MSCPLFGESPQACRMWAWLEARAGTAYVNSRDYLLFPVEYCRRDWQGPTLFGYRYVRQSLPRLLIVGFPDPGKTYKYCGEISSGKNGQTYLLELASTGVPFCLKTISPAVTQGLERERVRETLKKEVSILTPLRHRCLPQIFDKTLDGPLPYYVCTFHHGKTLLKLKELGHQFSREEGICVVSSLIDVLEYLHEHGRTHCDLHADNLLISNKVFAEGILLIDFGSGHRDSDPQAETPERGFLPFKNEKGQARFRERLNRAAAIPDFQESHFRALGNALSLMARPFSARPREINLMPIRLSAMI